MTSEELREMRALRDTVKELSERLDKITGGQPEEGSIHFDCAIDASLNPSPVSRGIPSTTPFVAVIVQTDEGFDVKLERWDDTQGKLVEYARSSLSVTAFGNVILEAFDRVYTGFKVAE